MRSASRRSPERGTARGRRCPRGPCRRRRAVSWGGGGSAAFRGNRTRRQPSRKRRATGAAGEALVMGAGVAPLRCDGCLLHPVGGLSADECARRARPRKGASDVTDVSSPLRSLPLARPARAAEPGWCPKALDGRSRTWVRLSGPGAICRRIGSSRASRMRRRNWSRRSSWSAAAISRQSWRSQLGTGTDKWRRGPRDDGSGTGSGPRSVLASSLSRRWCAARTIRRHRAHLGNRPVRIPFGISHLG